MTAKNVMEGLGIGFAAGGLMMGNNVLKLLVVGLKASVQKLLETLPLEHKPSVVY